MKYFNYNYQNLKYFKYNIHWYIIEMGFWESVQRNNLTIPCADTMTQVGWIDDWKIIANSVHKHGLKWKCFVPFCLWNLWKSRNTNTFNNTKVLLDYSFVYDQAVEYSYVIKQHQRTISGDTVITVKWEPPDEGVVMLKLDGAVQRNPTPAGIGGGGLSKPQGWLGVGLPSVYPPCHPIWSWTKRIIKGPANSYKLYTIPSMDQHGLIRLNPSY